MFRVPGNDYSARIAGGKRFFLYWDSRWPNPLFRHLNLLEPFEREKQIDQICRRILARLANDRGKRVRDRGMKRHALDHQTGQIDPHALVGRKWHDLYCGFWRVATRNASARRQIVRHFTQLQRPGRVSLSIYGWFNAERPNFSHAVRRCGAHRSSAE